jgi:hypothetical protein
MKLAKIINHYEYALLNTNPDLLPAQLKALTALKDCRTHACGKVVLKCSCCSEIRCFPRSCGHRNCPQCQNSTTTQWLNRQKEKLLPVTYFMVTFTLPAQARNIAYYNQRKVYSSLFQEAVSSLKTLTLKRKALDGEIGMTGVLHTHSRRLDYHPHIHFIVPGGGFNRGKNQWKKSTKKFLIHVKALSKLFRGKFLAAMRQQNISYPNILHKKEWVVHCKPVGSGSKALEYLSRYLYRGVLSERNILSDANGNVTFSYIDSETDEKKTRTTTGENFLKLLLKHVLPKGFRRTRDFGFLHPAKKKLLRRMQLMLHVVLQAREPPQPKFTCQKCGKPMKVIGIVFRGRHTPIGRVASIRGSPKPKKKIEQIAKST